MESRYFPVARFFLVKKRALLPPNISGDESAWRLIVSAGVSTAPSRIATLRIVRAVPHPGSDTTASRIYIAVRSQTALGMRIVTTLTDPETTPADMVVVRPAGTAVELVVMVSDLPGRCATDPGAEIGADQTGTTRGRGLAGL